MIEILVPFADRLNLNGDVANALVLKKRLEWIGFDSTITTLQSPHDFDSAAARSGQPNSKMFLLIGHGSLAAMKSISGQKLSIVGLIDAVNKSGGCGLVVGSAYEWLEPHAAGVRISEFRQAELALPDSPKTIEVSGYVNSSANLPDCQWDGAVLKTRMHGPVLVKSNELCDYFIARLTGKSSSSSEKALELEGFVREAIAVAKSQRS
jgi:hypothetical protein